MLLEHLLDAVDGEGVRSLKELYERLDRSRGKGKIPLRLKRLADQPVGWVFEFIEQAIPGEDPRWITQDAEHGSRPSS